MISIDSEEFDAARHAFWRACEKAGVKIGTVVLWGPNGKDDVTVEASGFNATREEEERFRAVSRKISEGLQS